MRGRREGTPLPAIILVRPQLAENIGTAARAMLNCGLTDLRLVKPRPTMPHPRAIAACSGADSVIESARIFASVEEAAADLDHLYATTARARDQLKPVVTARQAAAEFRAARPKASASATSSVPSAPDWRTRNCCWPMR